MIHRGSLLERGAMRPPSTWGCPLHISAKGVRKQAMSPLVPKPCPASGGVLPGSSESQAPGSLAAHTTRPRGSGETVPPLWEGVLDPDGAQDTGGGQLWIQLCVTWSSGQVTVAGWTPYCSFCGLYHASRL